jgi:vacuolar iron transporter family protein
MLTRKNTGGNERHSDHFFSALTTGLGDGLIVPFAVLAGSSAAVNAAGNIAPFILLFTILTSLLMAGASYFTIRKEVYEKQTSPEQKKRDTKMFFANLGLSEEIQEQSAIDMLKENEIWDRLDEGQNANFVKSPTIIGFTTGLGYFIGGFVSLIPFLFADASLTALKISACITLPLLLVTGFIKSRNLPYRMWGAVRLMLTGAIAALAVFAVIRLIQ